MPATQSLGTAVGIILCCWSVVAGAALSGRLPATPNGTDYRAYYDDLLDITLLADADLAATSTFGVPGVFLGLPGIPDGTMAWTTAQAYIDAMNNLNGGHGYLNVNSWRLPRVRPINGAAFDSNPAWDGSTDYGYSISAPGTAYAGSTASEMAYLFYNAFGNGPALDTNGIWQPCSSAGEPFCLQNHGPFSNLLTRRYWSGTEFSDTNYAWSFEFSYGDQVFANKADGYYVWPVSDGDVLATYTHAYVVNTAGNEVQLYTLNQDTHALRMVRAFASGAAPRMPAVDRNNTFLYVPNSGDNTVSSFAIMPFNRYLTPVGSPTATPAIPVWVTLDPGGTHAYVCGQAAGGHIQTYDVDPVTGALAAVLGAEFAASCDTVLVDTPATGLGTRYGGNSFVVALLAAGSGSGLTDSVATFTVDQANGTLIPVPGSPFTLGTTQGQRASFAILPGGAFVSVMSRPDSTLSIAGLNPLTGVLMEASGAPFPVSSLPVATAFDAGGRFEFVVNSTDTVQAYRIDPVSGALSAQGLPVPTQTASYSAAVDPSGSHLYVTALTAGSHGTVATYTIDPGTGALGPVGAPIDAGEGPTFITIDPSGRFAYIMNTQQPTLAGAVARFSIDPATGALTAVGGPVLTGGLAAGSALTIHPNGQFAFVANDQDDTVSAFLIDAATGGLFPVTGSPYPAGHGPYSVAIDSSGSFAYVANHDDGAVGTISGYSINLLTGELAPLGSPFPIGGVTNRRVRALVATP